MDDRKLHLGFRGVDFVRSAKLVGLFKTEATFEAVEAVVVEVAVIKATEVEAARDSI